MPGREDLPSTLLRSPRKAQDTWVAAHDSALKHSFEKVGDHGEPKPERGPSDEQAARGAGQPVRPTHGGVDATASRRHLDERAKQLGIPGRSRMSEEDLVAALEQESRRRTARARRPG